MSEKALPRHGIVKSLTQKPAWVRYLFALAAAACAVASKLVLGEICQISISPYLPAFASIMISAALTGFGGGAVTTGIVTVWAFSSQPRIEHPGFLDTLSRCCILFFEGLLLSAGFERMIGSIRRSTQSEQWHRKLIETASEGIWLVGPEGRILFANIRLASMLGCTIQQMKGVDWEKFFFPEDLPMERIRHRNRRLERVEQFDRRLRRMDGRELWVLCSVNSFNEDDVDRGGYLAMMTDITERKTAEMALRRSEARFRGLFDNVLEGVYQSTRDGRIVVANPMLLRMLGLDREEDLNHPNVVQNLYVDPASRARYLDLLESDGSYQAIELQLRRRDGRVIDVLENARTVRDENGKILYYEGTLIDITERKRLERRLSETGGSEAVRSFAHALAHDFNNILTVISGHGELALSQLASDHPATIHVRRILNGYEEAFRVSQRIFTRLSQFPRDTRHGNSERFAGVDAGNSITPK